jgi:uncharacterized membrane protein YjfL (UPF0719 family)
MEEQGLDLSAIVAGLVGYAVSVLAAVVVVFVLYRLNTLLTSRARQLELLRGGHHAIAVALGAIVLCQAFLMRHAVFPVMAVVRDLFLTPVTARAAALVLAQSALFFVVVAGLSWGSVAGGAWLFTHLTGELPEQEEILNDNVAVAILFAFVLMAITAIVNEGIEDLSRSLIPYARHGVLRLP